MQSLLWWQWSSLRLLFVGAGRLLLFRQIAYPRQFVFPAALHALAMLGIYWPRRAVKEGDAGVLAFGLQTVLQMIDGRIGHEHRPADFQKGRGLDDLDMPPKMPGIAAEIT